MPRDAIATVVKELMLGEDGVEARAKALELRVSRGWALAKDESSFKNLANWKNSIFM